MSIKTLLLGALALAPTAINAAPTTAKAFDCRLHQSPYQWLVSNYIVTTNNDILAWGRGAIGVKGISRCEDCTVNSNLVLTCKCSELTYPDFGPVSSLDLSEHINVYNGFLLQDFKGTPKPPANVSSIKIPADNSFGIGVGGVNCFNPTKPEACKNYQVQYPGYCREGGVLGSYGGEPLTCWSYYNYPVQNYSGYWFIFEYMNIYAAAPNAWEFLYYDNVECKGEPMKVTTGSEVSKCLRFSDKLVHAVTARPLWNADY
ncbi:hypothetical protein DM02DRAFT_663010 [Periconia macrospinosa]|uniref:Cyanovirin-N domain-containing protein n=1 Tax=Periconia macrospinosa TaxID=97972 RepID=A0A2V1D560_9PLEO|nr:hypothetical protein DM02DRAFT_663010 [Periconia macrospinosa]